MYNLGSASTRVSSDLHDWGKGEDMTYRLAATALTLVVPIIVYWVVSVEAEPVGRASSARTVSELIAQVQQLEQGQAKTEKRVGELQEAISWLSRTSPPVGTVAAFAGEWPPRKGERGRWTEKELGWMLCDGRPLDSTTQSELIAVLGKAKLPDNRGLFLRGVDRGALVDPDSNTRDGGAGVGSRQSWATRAPVKPFDGEHDHSAGRRERAPSDPPNTDVVGKEFNCVLRPASWPDLDTHALTSGKGHPNPSIPCIWEIRQMAKIKTSEIVKGGDAETRPVNVAVHWIIKVK